MVRRDRMIQITLGKPLAPVQQAAQVQQKQHDQRREHDLFHDPENSIGPGHQEAELQQAKGQPTHESRPDKRELRHHAPDHRRKPPQHAGDAVQQTAQQRIAPHGVRLAACGDRHGEGLKQKAEEDSGRCDRPQLPLCTGKKDDDEHNCGEGQQISLKRHPIEPAECDARGSALMARRAQAEGKAGHAAGRGKHKDEDEPHAHGDQQIDPARRDGDRIVPDRGCSQRHADLYLGQAPLGIIPDLQHRVIGL